MVTRDPGNDSNLLKVQYARLRDALEGYYSGKEQQVLNVATTLRVLVHDKPPSTRSLLSRLNPKYWDLTIYDKPPLKPGTLFSLRSAVGTSSGGVKHALRPTFGGIYQHVSIKQWWDGDYQALGTLRLSKRTIVLTVADKDGGTHVDDTVPDAHAALSEPPLFLGMNNAGHKFAIQPNMAYGITAQAGCEMQECLERHFPYVK